MDGNQYVDLNGEPLKVFNRRTINGVPVEFIIEGGALYEPTADPNVLAPIEAEIADDVEEEVEPEVEELLDDDAPVVEDDPEVATAPDGEPSAVELPPTTPEGDEATPEIMASRVGPEAATSA